MVLLPNAVAVVAVGRGAPKENWEEDEKGEKGEVEVLCEEDFSLAAPALGATVAAAPNVNGVAGSTGTSGCAPTPSAPTLVNP